MAIYLNIDIFDEGQWIFMVMERIDVAIITKNSVEPCLKEMLTSVIKEIPINRVIVVDGYSTDGTINLIKSILNKHSVKYVIEYDDGNRATARQKAIELVETDFFAFIDTDVILVKGWYKNMMSSMKDDVGVVWGLAVMDKSFNPVEWDIYRVSLWLRGLDEKEGLYLEGLRGYTHDVIFRTEAIKDIRIPAELHVLEDYYIIRHVLEKGYKYIVVKDAYVIHKFRSSLKEQRLLGRFGLKYGALTNKNVISKLLSIMVMPLAVSVMVGNPEAALYKLQKDINFLIGVLSLPISK